jgi:hypothetical protein
LRFNKRRLLSPEKFGAFAFLRRKRTQRDLLKINKKRGISKYIFLIGVRENVEGALAALQNRRPRSRPERYHSMLNHRIKALSFLRAEAFFRCKPRSNITLKAKKSFSPWAYSAVSLEEAQKRRDNARTRQAALRSPVGLSDLTRRDCGHKCLRARDGDDSDGAFSENIVQKPSR